MIQLAKKTGVYAPVANRHLEQKTKVTVQADQGKTVFF